MEQEIYGAVYITTNLLNNKKYIGSFLYSRINDWEKYLGSGVYLVKDIQFYGRDNFQKEIVSDYPDKKSLREAEEALIKSSDAVNSEEYYNLKYSAIGGDTFSTNPNKEDTRELHSKNAKGSNNWQFDKDKTDTFIDSVKKANSREVIVERVKYTSLTQASSSIGISITSLSYRLDSDGFPEYIRLHPKQSREYTSSNKPVPVEIRGVGYKSIAEASRATNETTTKIRKRLKFDDDYKLLNTERLSKA